MITAIILLFAVYLIVCVVTLARCTKYNNRLQKKEYIVVIILIFLLLSLTNSNLIAEGQLLTKATKMAQTGSPSCIVEDIVPFSQNMRTTVYKIVTSATGSSSGGIIAFTQLPVIPLYQVEFILLGEYGEPFAFASDAYFGKIYRFALDGETLSSYPIRTDTMQYIFVGALLSYIIYVVTSTKSRYLSFGCP